MAKVSPLEIILNTPGLVHLAENIFDNLDHESLQVCRDINQSSKQILDNPMFWLRKFGQLSNEKNRKDWIKVLRFMNKEKKGKRKKEEKNYHFLSEMDIEEWAYRNFQNIGPFDRQS